MIPDRFCRCFRGSGGNLASKKRNIERGRTGRHAGRILAEIAAIGGQTRLMRVKGRRDVVEIRRDLIGGQTPRNDPGGGLAVSQAGLSQAVFSMSVDRLRLQRGLILSGGKFYKVPLFSPIAPGAAASARSKGIAALFLAALRAYIVPQARLTGRRMNRGASPRLAPPRAGATPVWRGT